MLGGTFTLESAPGHGTSLTGSRLPADERRPMIRVLPRRRPRHRDRGPAARCSTANADIKVRGWTTDGTGSAELVEQAQARRRRAGPRAHEHQGDGGIRRVARSGHTPKVLVLTPPQRRRVGFRSALDAGLPVGLALKTESPQQTLTAIGRCTRASSCFPRPRAAGSRPAGGRAGLDPHAELSRDGCCTWTSPAVCFDQVAEPLGAFAGLVTRGQRHLPAPGVEVAPARPPASRGPRSSGARPGENTSWPALHLPDRVSVCWGDSVLSARPSATRVSADGAPRRRCRR